MFFETAGKTYHVKFSRLHTTTFATLFVVEESGTMKETGIEGVATLYYKDAKKFEKSKGRKVALADLLYQISPKDEEGPVPGGLTKEDRAKIWEEYFKTHRK